MTCEERKHKKEGKRKEREKTARNPDARDDKKREQRNIMSGGQEERGWWVKERK